MNGIEVPGKIEIASMPKIENVMSAYSGKPGKCMCGCSGRYYYLKNNQVKAGQNRGYKVSDDEVSDRMVKKIFNAIFGSPCIEVIENYIYTAIVDGRKYTVYSIKE